MGRREAKETRREVGAAQSKEEEEEEEQEAEGDENTPFKPFIVPSEHLMALLTPVSRLSCK